MTGFWEDFRFAFRMLRKSPGFTAIAVLVLGLGIGANTAVFSFLNGLFLRPFPFEKLDALVTLWETHPQQERQADAAHAGSGIRNAVPPADYLEWKKSAAFEHVAAYRYRELNLSGGVDQPERVRGVLVAGEFFSMLGVRPMLGRGFLPEEETPGSDGVALLSHVLWKNRFGADPEVLGKTCALNGRTFTVVGVMPAEFDFPLGGVRIWLPLALSGSDWSDRATLSLLVLARLKDGVSLDQARSELAGITARLEQQYPQTNTGRRAALVPLGEQQVSLLSSFALLFQAAAGFVLLITCANLANLLLARGTGRQREVAVRTALGASRWRLVQQLLTESLLVSLLGGALALWLADGGVHLIRTSLPEDIAKWVGGWNSIQIDGRAMGFTLALAVLTSLGFGILPALQASRAGLPELLKEGGHASGSGGRNRLRSLLVISEVTLALVLLVGAGLMVRGFLGLMHIYQGFDPQGVMTLRIALPEDEYPRPQAEQFYGDLLDRLSGLPGVQSASIVSHLPADLGPVPGGGFSIEGRPVLTRAELPVADFQKISPDYFRTLQVPLLKGRAFGEQDGPEAPPVAILSDSTARRFWPGEDPIGKRVKLGPSDADGPWMSIVGVVSDVKQYWFDREPRLTLYLPYRQSAGLRMWILIRTSGDPESLVAAARAQVSGLDKDQPIFEVRTLAEVVRQSVAFVRISAALMVSLGSLALLLSALGVYGVMSHHVSQRTREIGIRLAVGASRSEILRLIVRQALKLTAVGLAVGLPLAVALTRLMTSALFGVVQPDVVGLVGIALGLAGVAVFASFLPARKAAGVDPLIALRHE
jgi:putative ABC transport system permease protein